MFAPRKAMVRHIRNVYECFTSINPDLKFEKQIEYVTISEKHSQARLIVYNDKVTLDIETCSCAFIDLFKKLQVCTKDYDDNPDAMGEMILHYPWQMTKLTLIRSPNMEYIIENVVYAF